MLSFLSPGFYTPPNTPVDKDKRIDPGPLDLSRLNKSLSDIVNDKIKEAKARPLSTASSHVMDPFNPVEDVGHRTDVLDMNSNYLNTPPENPKQRSDIQEARKRLPIYQFRSQFLNAVRNHQVVVVVGETGSGKSTQMPQYLLESGFLRGKIAVTQPRRVAAVSVSKRVAKEMECRLGDQVGYSIRFEDVSSPQTVIKYITDGLLLMDCLKDPTFSSYECVILDEAHERTLHTDVLLGLIKKALKHRPELKVIITSATLDIRKFADYFQAPMIKIPGEMFPVAVEYLPVDHLTKNRPLWIKAANPTLYLSEVILKVMEIHQNCPLPGDILVFVPGKEDVEQVCYVLSQILKQETVILFPVYAALPFEVQCSIFAPAKSHVRKIVVSTNIAETSLTIDGIVFVVDSGLFKESVFDNGIESLKTTMISKAQAEQRGGRAGRTAPGICYRMYTKGDFETLNLAATPAIHRIDFIATALQLKAMGIHDICGFGFMDSPKPGRVKHALFRLRDLGALDRGFFVTELGFKMSVFPLSPNLSKVLLTAADMGCSDEVMTIVSMLSVNHHIFVRPPRFQKEADACKTCFNDFKGDHITLLNVFAAWIQNEQSEEWSKENYVNQKELERALDIRSQLTTIMNGRNIPILSCGGRRLHHIRMVLSTGLPNNMAYRDHMSHSKGVYRTMSGNNVVFIHPSSALFKRNPELVIFHETVTTSRTFMRIVSVCERSWLSQSQRRVIIQF
ncbi:hypothetical protein TCAL_01271 [Tigriopus californicus]|uniref:RNA helicase n=1 Tax=Tigriopus californicus TaxID=6832 RepID=A0A553PDA5_TIGCA|nr:ATP-dependent RNA helicase dhx8-like [Tigriopus californicus]TRY75661.1 hypothetical protein TCAL_01271 [Tigriopus californicus]